MVGFAQLIILVRAEFEFNSVSFIIIEFNFNEFLMMTAALYFEARSLSMATDLENIKIARYL